MRKYTLQPGFRQAALALLLALGARVAWWSTRFDPLILLGYAIIVLGMVAIFVLFHEVGEARRSEHALEQYEHDEDSQRPSTR